MPELEDLRVEINSLRDRNNELEIQLRVFQATSQQTHTTLAVKIESLTSELSDLNKKLDYISDYILESKNTIKILGLVLALAAGVIAVAYDWVGIFKQ